MMDGHNSGKSQQSVKKDPKGKVIRKSLAEQGEKGEKRKTAMEEDKLRNKSFIILYMMHLRADTTLHKIPLYI